MGDRGARLDEGVAALFDDHYERLVRHLSIAAQGRDVAEEAVQEAFVQAHLHWRKIRAYDDPVAWVRHVALNRIRNHHRGLRRKRFALARLVRLQEREGESVEGGLGVPEVVEALGRLSLQQRLAVALHHLEGLSVDETAREMGIAAGTVKAHLHRARAALRDALEVRT